MTSISNLRIRRVRRSDFTAYYQMVKDPEVARGARFRPVKSVRRGRELFREDVNNSISFAVVVNGRTVGMISLYATVGADSAPDRQVLELAYMTLPAQQRHRYMTDALGMLIEHLKKTTTVKCLVALVDETNQPSIKVLERNHFINYRSVLDLNSDHADLVYQRNL